MQNTNGVDINGDGIKQMIFETCMNEGVDDLTSTTISSLVVEELQGYNMTALLDYKRARAFEEPSIDKVIGNFNQVRHEQMAEFGKAVSKIIVEEIIMNENITVLK